MIVTVAVLFSMTSVLQAAVIPGRWEKVGELNQGASIVVRLKAGDSMAGEFAGLEENSVRLVIDNHEREFPKSEISQVSLVKPGWSRQKKAGIAALIGVPIGFALGYAAAPKIVDDDTISSGERVGVGFFFGGLIGGSAAGIAAIRGPKPMELVVYEANATEHGKGSIR
jgi:hypothetical protein